MSDKVMTADEVAAGLRSGMTVGIGGWGSRRKPMALVKAVLRSGVTDLTVVSFGARTSACWLRQAGSAGWSPPSSPWTRSPSNRTSAPPGSTAASNSPSWTRP